MSGGHAQDAVQLVDCAVRLNAYIVQNVVTYDTVIDFENPDERLLPGETAYVTISTGRI